MKSLSISTLCLVILIVGWFIFADFADDTLHNLMNYIEDDIITYASNENWEEASKNMEDLNKRWHRYKRIYAFFLSTDDINETDYSIARAIYFIKSEDVSNSTGELNCIKEQLRFLHFNETLTLENIF
ncbi:DUF4363 family protein [Anaerovorax odorimutans]|uniref:DUF4363 family protein n=1 Tax=Anaerovorax odorimutans TaxID=109327 RepID=UPI000429266B|nr:DUF4363 family protein [Anaerovorax odorimutans]